ncbi:hypothetical protein DJFAAGMI_02618 [Comamonas sp. PE63]|uniref:Uncharacterized protein n=1 Tax=Comamonas brasiliensis TaxID=1812482 RepID=A0ABS5LTP0_9BURK|nr:hypothetical protein [Comamonas sp. PE63]MBS3019865.1 hypothetical protein [Comamonas sp. PE63]
MIFHQSYEVHTAASGAADLQILQSTPINMLIGDQHMLDMMDIKSTSTSRTCP